MLSRMLHKMLWPFLLRWVKSNVEKIGYQVCHISFIVIIQELTLGVHVQEINVYVGLMEMQQM